MRVRFRIVVRTICEGVYNSSSWSNQTFGLARVLDAGVWDENYREGNDDTERPPFTVPRSFLEALGFDRFDDPIGCEFDLYLGDVSKAESWKDN